MGRHHVPGPVSKEAITKPGKHHIEGPTSKEAVTRPGKHHVAGPVDNQIPNVKLTGKEPTIRVSAKQGLGTKNSQSDMSQSQKPIGKAKTSPTKAREAAKTVEVPIFRKEQQQQHIDPMSQSSLQQKVIDRPLMFRNRGLHPRTTTPGRTANRFKKSNTNTAFWSGDVGLQSSQKQPDIRDSQRVQATLRVSEKYKPKQVGLFFVADKKASSSKKASGTDDLFGASQTMSKSFDHTFEEKPRELDCLSGSRRGPAPSAVQSVARATLKVGQLVPDEHASISRHYGKKLNEKQSGSPRTLNEQQHHGKKPFPEKVATSVKPQADAIGSPKRTNIPFPTEALKASKRFENTRRYNSNLHAGLEPNDNACIAVGGEHGKKGKPEFSPTKKNGGKTLQYVFEAPQKAVNATYRPVAPWATD